jgi:glycosyltransferase involved in cell wall biosynthesis
VDDLRSTLGIESGEVFLLQPTRVVPRKGIERSIELAARLERRCVLVVSHASGDEGTAYEEYLRCHADLIGVRIIFAAETFARRRGYASDGRKVYALSDAYRQADLVTYPSIIEGFGNAFLEAVYYRRPIVVNRYDVLRTDIEPKGFDTVVFDGFIREETVRCVEAILEDTALQAQIVAHNYSLGQKHYSYRTLENHLTALLDKCADT